MPRRPKGAKPNVTLDQIRRSVATSTAIKTAESSETIEARLKARRCSADDESDSGGGITLAQPDHMAHKLSLLSDIQVAKDTLVRAADIDRLPQELQEIVWGWMRGQTMLLINDEPWIYSHDWRRFIS